MENSTKMEVSGAHNTKREKESAKRDKESPLEYGQGKGKGRKGGEDFSGGQGVRKDNGIEGGDVEGSAGELIGRSTSEVENVHTQVSVASVCLPAFVKREVLQTHPCSRWQSV